LAPDLPRKSILIPPVGWGDVATRRDVELLQREIESLRNEVGLLESRLEAWFDAMLDAKLGQLRSELLRTLGTLLFASQAAVIAAVSVLVALD
jgi:hypothetical protein